MKEETKEQTMYFLSVASLSILAFAGILDITNKNVSLFGMWGISIILIVNYREKCQKKV